MNIVNSKGIRFSVKNQIANVPEDADYFAFYFIVTVDSENPKKQKIYKAFVRKSICPDLDSAKTWLANDAFLFLTQILDTYHNGETLFLLPGASLEWGVV